MANIKEHPKTETVSFRLTPDRLKQLEEIALQGRQRVGTIAADIVERYLQNR